MADLDPKHVQLVAINAALICLAYDVAGPTPADDDVIEAIDGLVAARAKLIDKYCPDTRQPTQQQVRDFVEFHEINQKALGWL